MQYNLYESNDFIQRNNIINKLNNQYQNSNPKDKDVNYFSKNIKDYRFGPLLGKGAFGEVFKAVSLNEKSFGEVVAIKRINIKKINAVKMIKRIRNEIEIQYQLNHPSILRLYNFSETDEYVYLIMEYCENGELYKYLQKRHKLPEEEAKSVMEQLVEGVKYLHHRGILHRDLKLSNLFLTSNYNLKIGDFGLATQLNESNSEQYTLCGTPNYIAPEIIQRQPYSLPTDIWSIGCLFVTLLTGKPPFECKEIPKTLEKVINVSYEIPSYISVTAADLIDKLLQKDPVKRISLDKILDHLFFKTGKTAKPLSPIINSPSESSKILADLSMKLHNKMLVDMYNNKEQEEDDNEPKFNEISKNIKNLEKNIPTNDKIGLTYENNNKYNKHYNDNPENSEQNNIQSYRHYINQNYENNVINKDEKIDSNKPSDLYNNINNFSKKENNPKDINSKEYDQYHLNNELNRNAYYNHDTSSIASSAIKKEKLLNLNAIYDNDKIYQNRSRSNSSSSDSSNKSSNNNNKNKDNNDNDNNSIINNTKTTTKLPENHYYKYNYTSSNINNLDMKNKRHTYQPYTTTSISSSENITTINNSTNPKDSHTYSKLLSNTEPSMETPITELNKEYSNMLINDINRLPKIHSSSDLDKKYYDSDSFRFNHELKRYHSLSILKQQSSTLPSSETTKNEDEYVMISTERLKPCKVSFKAGKLEILKSGHVFVRFTKDNYILIISGNGEKIFVYNKELFSETESGENILKSSIPKTTYIFGSLPSSLYSIYSAISKIIQYIRSKTPKIIFYSPQAQCLMMENQPYPDFEMRFYNDIKINLRVSHQAIEINLPVKYLEEQNYMKNVNMKAIENNALPLKIPMTNFESSYLISEKLYNYINSHYPSILHPLIKHFQVCFKQCLSFQNNKTITKYPLIVKCKVMEDKKVEEEETTSESNNVLPVNRVLSRTNSNSLLNAKSYSSHNLNEESEGIISSSSIVNNLNLNSTTNDHNISSNTLKKFDNYTNDVNTNSVHSTTLFNTSSLSINQTPLNNNNPYSYNSSSYLQSTKNGKFSHYSEGLLRKAHSDMNLHSKKDYYTSNLYSNSEMLASINEIDKDDNSNNGLSKFTNDNSSPDTSQTMSKRNSSPMTYHSTNTTTATSSATVTNKSQPSECLSSSSSPSNTSTSSSVTTFIPKVGWCIKTYGKFSIFFVDGTNIILESRKPNQLQYLNYQDANYKKHIIYYLDQPIPKDVKQKLSYIFKFRELMKTNSN